MGITEKDVDNVRDCLTAWKLTWCGSEKEYEDAAYRYLNESFPKEKFERQYWRGKTKADLHVEFKDGAAVVIEMKRDVKDRGEYHRLIGQVYEYVTEWKVAVLVVLCGENDPALVKNVESFVAFMQERTRRKIRFLHLACSPAPKS
jgi:hypothetical protein